VLTFVFAFGAGAAGAALLRGDDGAAQPTGVTSPTTAVPTTTIATPKPIPNAQPARRLLPSQARSSFGSLGPGLALAVAPVGRGSIQVFGDRSLRASPGGHAWSTMKIALVAQLVLDRGRVSRLTAVQRGHAKAALTVSDNAAAAAIFEQLKADHGGLEGASAKVTELLQRAGDGATQVSQTTDGNPNAVSTYGQTHWPASAAVRFLRALARGCILGEDGTRYELGLMAGVREERGWGIGAAGYDGDIRVAFKGGWGQEADNSWLVRQLGVVGTGPGAVVIAIVARAPSLAVGQARVTAAAQWLRAHAVTSARAAAGCG
jgi:hypothetical protein